jgi:hypothetical protein
MERNQIQLKSKDILRDKLVVEKILLNVAEKFHLFDNTITSKVPNTIKSLVEREHYGFGIGARVVAELIIVDFVPHKNPPPRFEELCRDIKTDLFHAFPGKAKEFDENEPGYYRTTT